jgi:hypothetical protein
MHRRSNSTAPCCKDASNNHMNQTKTSRRRGRRRGFIAVTAVIVISCLTLVYAILAIVSASDFSDSVTRREWRMQANLNAASCISTIELLAWKDYFLTGSVEAREFGCTAYIARDHIRKSAEVHARARFAGVTSADIDETFAVW